MNTLHSMTDDSGQYPFKRDDIKIQALRSKSKSPGAYRRSMTFELYNSTVEKWPVLNVGGADKEVNSDTKNRALAHDGQ